MSKQTKLRVVPLTNAEADALQEHELIISQGLSAFIAVGRALIAIRDGKLYRADFKTFEDYCRKRWNFTDRRARQLIEATEVAEEIGTSGSGLVIENERQARALAMVPPNLRKEVAQRLTEEGLDPTEQSVTKVVNKLLEEKRVAAREQTEADEEDEPEEEDVAPGEDEDETPAEKTIRRTANRCGKERMYLARGMDHGRLESKDLGKVDLRDLATPEARQALREHLDRKDELYSKLRLLLHEAEREAAA